MLLQKVVNFFLIFMCTNVLSNGVLTLKITKKSIYFKHYTPLIIDDRSLASPGMVFGHCSENVSLTNKRHCDFILETNKPISSQDHLSFCSFVLNSVENKRIDNIREVIAFGEDKAILIWSNEDNLNRYSIIYFSDCRVTNVKIDDNIHIYDTDIITMNEEIFEVIEPNDGKSSCTHAKYCKLTIDDEGTVLTGLIKWKDNELNEIVAVASSPSKGYLIVDTNKDNTIVRLFVGDQILSIIKEYRGNRNLLHTVTVSSSQKHLTICYLTNSWTEAQNSDGICECSQFDLDGRLKFEITLNFVVGINSANIYNLPGGGFLILSETCSLDRHSKCHESFYKNLLIVTKINANGDIYGSFGISEFRLDKSLYLKQIHWFLNEQEENCLSAVYKPEEENSSVDLSIVCFSDTDFANSLDWLRA